MWLRILQAFVVLALQAAPAAAQTVCDAPSQASTVLDVAGVRAALFNGGGLFFDGRDALYEVPDGSGSGALFAASLWLGGYVGGELRLAAATYRENEFRPGPLGDDGLPRLGCEEADRIDYLTHAGIATAYADDDLARLSGWPADLGAPYRDRDGRPGYDPEAGDVPLILGDGMAWWVMNDVASPHAENGTPPIGMQVEASVWAFDAPGWIGTTAFFRYVLSYRGKASLDSAYLAFFFDPDLGGAGDDYVGSDSTLHLAYAYNGFPTDADYGDRPPALGFVVLDGPRAPADNGLDDDRDGEVDEPGERHGMSAFMSFSGGVQDSPHAPEEYMRAMQARWSDGRPMTHGGTGRGFSAQRALFAFPAEPGTFWSEGDIDGRGTMMSPSDRQAMWSVGPFRMAPGQTDTLTFAIVFSRDVEAENDQHYASVAKLKRDVRTLLATREAFLRPREDLYERYRLPEPDPPVPGVRPPVPNPVRDVATLLVTFPGEVASHLDLYDVLGRRVRRVAIPPRPGVEQRVRLDLGALPAGVYVWRVVAPGVGAFSSGTLVKL